MKTKKWMLVFSMISILSAGAATAQSAPMTCDDFKNLQLHVTTDDGIVRKADGSVYNPISQYNAKAYCECQGERLPTARELALYSQSLGAKGISETNKYEYTLVKGSDSAGNSDFFYFNSNGYQRPAGDLGNHFFWSSSVHPDYSSKDAYFLNGDDGDIFDGLRSHYYNHSAVRCMSAAR